MTMLPFIGDVLEFTWELRLIYRVFLSRVEVGYDPLLSSYVTKCVCAICYLHIQRQYLCCCVCSGDLKGSMYGVEHLRRPAVHLLPCDRDMFMCVIGLVICESRNMGAVVSGCVVHPLRTGRVPLDSLPAFCCAEQLLVRTTLTVNYVSRRSRYA